MDTSKFHRRTDELPISESSYAAMIAADTNQDSVIAGRKIVSVSLSTTMLPKLLTFDWLDVVTNVLVTLSNYISYSQSAFLVPDRLTLGPEQIRDCCCRATTAEGK